MAKAAMETAHSENDALNAKLSEQAAEAAALRTSLESREADANELQTRLDALGREMARLLDQFGAIVTRQDTISAGKREVAQLAELIDGLRSQPGGAADWEAELAKTAEGIGMIVAACDCIEHDQQDVIRQAVPDLRGQAERLDRDVANMLSQTAQLRDRVGGPDELNARLDAADKAEAELDQTRTRMAELGRQLGGTEAARRRLGGELDSVRARLATAKAKIEKLRTQAQRFRGHVDELKTKLTEEEGSSARLQRENEDLRSKVDSSNKELEQLRNQLDSRDDPKAQLAAMVAEVTESKRLRAENRELSEKLDASETELKGLREFADATRTELEQLQEREDDQALSRGYVRSLRAQVFASYVIALAVAW
jgi:chromosome segregation ATPase